MVDDPDRLRHLGEDRVALAQRLLGLALRGHVDERHHDAAAVGRSIGTAVTETGNIVPSRRTNQSSSHVQRPLDRADAGHSSTGNGEPSGCL